MNNFFRAIIAGYGATKLGGGCFGTILVFVLIWVALGQCSSSSRKAPPPETYPAAHRVYIPVQPQTPGIYTLNLNDAFLRYEVGSNLKKMVFSHDPIKVLPDRKNFSAVIPPAV